MCERHKSPQTLPRCLELNSFNNHLKKYVTKLSVNNFDMFQDHRNLETLILGVQRRFRVKCQHPNTQPPHTSNSVQNCVLSPITSSQ